MQKYFSSGAVCSAWVWTAVVALVALIGVGVTAAAADTAARPNVPAPVADPVEAVVQPVAEWLERANREYQDNVLKALSIPTGKSVPVEAAKAAGQPASGAGIVSQIQSLLGIETAKDVVPDPAAIAAAKEREVALKRQIEARKLEQERNADAQRVAEQQKAAAEAKKAAEFDVVTRQSQKTAELARLAEEERRKEAAAGKTGDKVTGERKLAMAADKAAAEKAAVEKAENDRRNSIAAEKAANERVVAAAAEKAAAEKVANERKLAAAAEKVAAEKVANERKVAAAAEKAAAEKVANERKVAAAVEKAEAEKVANERKVAAAAGNAVEAVKRGKEAADSDTTEPTRSAAAVASATKADPPSKSRIKVSSRKGHGRSGHCSRAGRDVGVPAIYVVKSGDTLWDISRRYYDKGHKFEKIVRANANKIDSPDLIFPCQKIYLPGRHAFFLIMPMDGRDAS